MDIYNIYSYECLLKVQSTYVVVCNVLTLWSLFQPSIRLYRIRPNFQGTQFLQVAISKHFAETIFADQGFQVYSVLQFSRA